MGRQSAVLNSVISLSLFEKIRCDQRLEEGEEGVSHPSLWGRMFQNGRGKNLARAMLSVSEKEQEQQAGTEGVRNGGAGGKDRDLGPKGHCKDFGFYSRKTVSESFQDFQQRKSQSDSIFKWVCQLISY